MKRRLLNLLTLLSLVLCVGTVTLWVRSYYYWDNCVWSGRACVAGYTSNWGGVSFFLDTPADPAHWPFTGSRLQFSGERRTWAMGVGIPTSDPALNRPWVLRWGAMELAVFQAGIAPPMRVRQIYFRHWLLAAALAALPVLRLPSALARRRRAARSMRRGLCPRCGYDLRATPDRCPECGALPGTAPAA